MRLSSAIVCLSLAASPAAAADLILVNGKVWTVHPRQPQAEAVAVRAGRIVAVGKSEEIRKIATQKAVVIDLKGRRVLPGFHDSHVHFLGAGMRLAQVALKDAKDEEEFGKRLKAFDAKLPKGRWMLGGDWDHDRTFNGKLPDAALLDKYVPDRPVLLRRYDGHVALANSKALKLAGIDAKTPDPSGGVIFRKPNSKEPTGLLRDNAMGLVDRLIPSPDAAEVAEAVRASLALARSLGVTAVVDMDGSGADTRRLLFRLYQQLARDGKLTCRVELRWPLAQWRALADLGVQWRYGDEYLRIGGL